MAEHVETILRLVAEGKLSAEEAEPVLAALAEGDGTRQQLSSEGEPGDADTWRRAFASRSIPPLPPIPPQPPQPTTPPSGSVVRRQLRIEVTEKGQRVVNLRIPLGLAGMAASLVPGLAAEHADRIREAIRAGSVGPIIEVDGGDGDRVVIATE